MPDYVATEEEATHYKSFLHWDDADQPLVTIFTDMVDPQESRPRLERMLSWIVFPEALITKWDRSGELLSGVSDIQLPPGVEAEYLRLMAAVSRHPYSVTDRSAVEESYHDAIRSVRAFREVLQRSMEGVAYATREIDTDLNKVFWAAGIRANELEVQLEHWELVHTLIEERCGAGQARRIARSVASGNTVRFAMEDASASEIAQQTGLPVEDVAAALNQASDEVTDSDEDENDTNGLNGNGYHGNGYNGNGRNGSDDHSAMDTEF